MSEVGAETVSSQLSRAFTVLTSAPAPNSSKLLDFDAHSISSFLLHPPSSTLAIMVYTQHRLQEALSVFREAKRRDKQKQLHSLNRTSKYHLRRAARAAATQITTYVTPSPESDVSSEGDDEYSPTTSQKKRNNLVEVPIAPCQKRKAEQLHADRHSKHAFTTLVLTSARASRLLLELGQKYNTDVRYTWALNHCCRLNNEPQDPVERDLKARQKARADLEQQINNQAGCASRNSIVPDGKLPENASSKYVPCLPTPPPSGPLSDSDSSILSCDSPQSVAALDSLAKIGSTFDDPIVISSPSPQRSQLKHKEVINLDSDSEKSLLEIEFTANTNWAHPIDFKLCPELTGLPCDFCSNCIFGIEGLGPCRPTFVQRPNSHEWEEVGNGHRAAGKPATSMCVRCATQRIRISMCQRHIFELIPSISSSDFPFQDYDRCLADLIEGHAPATPEFKYQMCSLCTRPAFYRCSFPQSRSITMQPLPPEQRQRGCGLHVCEHCVAQIEKHDGRLKKCYMDQHAEKKTIENERFFQYRADAEFLEPRSLLRMAYGI